MSTLDVNATSTTDVDAKCSLNNRFGIVVQAILALSAFSVLIVKRWREPTKERRQVKIWFCDTSKQAIGAMLIHFANVFLAELSREKDPCTWYFINYLLDTTIGLLVIWFALRLLHYIASRKGWRRLKMGEYGSPPEFKTWLHQCIAYIVVMFIEKAVILLLFQFRFWMTVKEFILKPVSSYPKLEVVIVVLLVPFLMNALMFWVVDNFLMRKHHKLVSAVVESENPVQYANNKQRYSVSDDEVNMHLIENEAKDTLIEDCPGSENDGLHRRNESLSR